MKVFRNLSDITPTDTPAAAVTIGNFDGVHRGHQALLQRAVETARNHNGTACAMTFDPHPQAVLKNDAPAAIATLEQRTEWIADCGIDCLLIQPFDDDFSKTEPDAFLDAIFGAFGPNALVLGHDFRFGSGGKGTVADALEHARKNNYRVTEMPQVFVDEQVVSSSKIRTALAAGDVRSAGTLLGRPWQIRGVVTSGAGRGKTLGYPTVNIDTANQLIVPDGVYGGRLQFDGHKGAIAAISIGTNPTFGDEPRHAEAFVLDYDGPDISGAVKLELHTYVRTQVKFSDAAKLIAQISADVETIRGTAQREGWMHGA